MNINIIETANGKLAIVNSDTPLISDGQSALDFTANIAYEHDCRNIIVNKTAIAEEFFKLSSGVAGEVAQKLVNYSFRLAIVGDFSGYTSKALNDFIYESNKGKHLYFVADEDEAIKKLGL